MTPATDTYNGWPNVETWRVHVAISNTPDHYRDAIAAVRAGIDAAAAIGSTVPQVGVSSRSIAADRLREWAYPALALPARVDWGGPTASDPGAVDWFALASHYAPADAWRGAGGGGVIA